MIRRPPVLRAFEPPSLVPIPRVQALPLFATAGRRRPTVQSQDPPPASNHVDRTLPNGKSAVTAASGKDVEGVPAQPPSRSSVSGASQAYPTSRPPQSHSLATGFQKTPRWTPQCSGSLPIRSGPAAAQSRVPIAPQPQPRQTSGNSNQDQRALLTGFPRRSA